MQKKQSVNWAKYLVLPLILAACGGQSDPHNHAEDAPSASPKAAVSNVPEPREEQTASKKATKTTEPAESAETAKSTPAEKSQQDAPKAAPKTASVQEKKEKKEEAPAKTPEINTPAKTPEVSAQEALAKKVIKAKAARDNAGLPPDYQADYVITTPNGTTTAKLKAPEESGNNNADHSNYYFNSGEIFPQGESTGTVKTSLAEDGKTRKPHTEETFMSYQQFYSGISGSQKQVVYFGDERVERDEPFYFELPVGLVTAAQNVPLEGIAIYKGKAIDGKRFGDFSYTVDFANKEGKGGSIIWDKSAAGIGDILLEGGKIGAQVLSVYADPEMYPDEYSHRATGVKAKAVIQGADPDKEYEYGAVFFGLEAEEFAGLVYEKEEHTGHSHGGLAGIEEIETTKVASFTGQR